MIFKQGGDLTLAEGSEAASDAHVGNGYEERE